MAYCPECGEEVAEIDIFCPYCGISLQPVAIIGEDQSQENTIAINHAEIAQTLEKTDSSDDASVSAAKIENASDAQSEIGAIRDEDSSESTVEDFKPEVEQPLNLPPESQNDYFASVKHGEITENADDSKTDPSIPSEELESEAALKAEAKFGNEAEFSMMSYEEAEVKEAKELEELEGLSTDIDKRDGGVDTEVKADEQEFIHTIPYEPKIESEVAVSHQEQNESAPTNSVEQSQSPNLSEENPDTEMNQSSEVASELGSSIEKPDFELEDEDLSPGISKFDSVRIMESREEALADSSGDLEVKPAPSELNVEPQSPAAKFKAEDESERKARSYTTPIGVGVSDTDGKKSKLKPLEEGIILNGRYEIVRKIGGGGMGAVYLASDKNLGGVLRAVKEMVQSYIGEDQQEKAVNDFKRESLLLTSLEHSAIPTIFDYFYDDKECRFYLVMKYINGGDLSARLRSAPDGKIDEKSVVEWAIQIADVLDYLHRRQPPIVYRDLKPANIMLDGNSGKIMLIDFGIARWVNKEEKGVTAVGTMGYAPPELFSGNVETRSDIYSLGSTMFHLLTGADPQSNPLLIFDFQKNPRPRQINPQLSDQIERILMRAVEYNAAKRFLSAAEMRDALEDHLKNLKISQVSFGIKEAPQAATLSDQKVFCGFCGQSIVASDLFCAFCGAKQPIAQKGVHSESYSPVPVTAKLMIIGTNELESPAYAIEKDENLVGRRDPMSNIFPEVDLSRFDPQTKISRRHARIWREGNSYMVEDLGSSNGTILMPVVTDAFRLMPNKPHILTNGDKLRLGDTTLHFILG